jgi:hypothetical protein
MNRFKSALSKIVAALGITLAATATAKAPVGEGVNLARARGHFVHQRPREWIALNTLLSAEDHVRREDGMVPAYRDDDGVLTPGRRWVTAPEGHLVPDPRDVEMLWEGDNLNVKTTVGIDFIFAQSYSASASASVGFSFIALSNDTLTETSASTTLSTEIAANGLSRVAATYAHTTATSTATLAHTFTCTTTSQAAQKAALFTLVSSGVMNHALAFTQRTLQVGDTLAVTFTITIT